MRFSKFFAPTLKEIPKDATLKSHEYLIRGGFIQQVGSGIYNFLPLGKRVLDNIKRIVKEEMDSSGAHEVMLGFVTPAELWKESGRFEKYGKELLRFKDRKNNDFVLGPTHEEMVVELAKGYVKSYKQLPLHLYQMHVKFRDEIRPRFGIMRSREFIMKDGYSFHDSQEDLVREFNNMEVTYRRIFTRLGLRFRAVEADSGAIGGSGSKEFMVLADSGEDTIVVCDSCEYAANIEAAKRTPKTCDADAPTAQFAKFKTPGVCTIDALAEFFKIDPYYTMKAVVKKALFDGGRIGLAFFFLRGCDSLQEVKACNAIGANELLDASKEELERAGVLSGFIGPYALRNLTGAEHIVFDSELKDARNLITGANELDYHFIGVDLSEFEGLVYRDITQVEEGDKCPCCGGNLSYTKGIEVGHIFQLGTRYSEPLSARFLDRDGKSQPLVMGCYGIGITRLLAAIIEQNHDERGCIWTHESAPFYSVIIVSNIKDSTQMQFAEWLYNSLKNRKVPVLLDDRDERFGSKMADFELIGFPSAVIIGKGIADGNIEIVRRKMLEKEVVRAENALARVWDICTEYIGGTLEDDVENGIVSSVSKSK
ncbi:MAG: proline--tRNA ligase [Wolinella sp.]